MKLSLDDYREIVGDNVIASIHRKASRLYRKHIVHINSTYQGGGVAEMLQTLVPLMNDVGVDTGWRILHGNPDFFSVTKKFHNGLQGEKINFSRMKRLLHTNANENFSTYTHLDHDCIIVHDPQPLPLIKFYQKRQPWIWRCHIDLSHPSEELWEYLKTYLLRYNTMIVSNKNYLKSDLPINQRIIHPAIDPISAKNKPINDGTIPKTLERFSIPTDKPLITQISRFDKWKDPLGVLKVFKKVRKEIDCRLVLCGNMASDDPEGLEIYEEVKEKGHSLIETGDLILLTIESNLLVNVLQRVSNVIIQKSTREGFGLVVTEALWKGRPVVASNIGGIPLQVKDGVSGYLLDPNDLDGFAAKVTYLLKNPAHAEKMGQVGKEFVRENFLITRLLINYLDLLASTLNHDLASLE